MRASLQSRVTRTLIVSSVLALAAVGVAVPAGATARSTSAKTSTGSPVSITIGTAGATAVYDPVFTGMEDGIFKNNGFNIIWDDLTPSSAAAAVLNGNVDLAMAGNSMIASILVQPSAKIIFTNGPTVFYLVAAAGITKISQLAGKTCAATTAGGAIDTALRGAFAAAHVAINIAYVGTNSAALAGLEAGKVQCAGVSPPTYEQAQQAGLSVVEPISKYTQTSFIAANTAWAHAHRRALVKFLKVYAEIVKVTRDQRIQAEGGLRDYVGTTDLSQLNGSWNQYRKYWELEPYPPAQMRATFAGLLTANPPVPEAKGATLSQVIDNSYIDACGKSCIVAPLTKGAWS